MTKRSPLNYTIHPKKQSFKNIEVTVSCKVTDFNNYISAYENFPKSGILFRDISPLLASPEAMHAAIESFTNQLSDLNADMIAGIEMQDSGQIMGKSVILIDDLLATGGTFVAAKTLLEQCGAVVAAGAVVVELKALNGRKAVGLPIVSLQSYD